MSVRFYTILIFIISLSLLGVSCNDSSTGVDTTGSATFQGKVESTNSSQASSDNMNTVEGAVVSAAYVQADGSLQMIGNSQAQTNAQGEYRLEVDISAAANATDRVVIIAESSGETAKAVVSSRVESGTTVTVEPITFESSAEAEVYQDVVANGNTEMVTKADVEFYVGSQAAADIESNADNAARLAAGLAAAAEARATFYAEQGIDYSEDKRQQIAEMKHEAAVRLTSELHAASSLQEKQAAINTFMQAVATAEVEAGVEAWAAAEASDLSARILLKESAAFSSDAQADIRQHSYYYMAVALDAAVRAQAQAAGAAQATLDALAEAGATLRAELRAMTNATASAVNQAFTTYNESVQAAVNSDASLSGSAFVTTNTAISGSSGIKSTLESTLAATADVSTMMSAYSSFAASIRSMVDSNFSQAGEAEATAYARMLILINLAS